MRAFQTVGEWIEELETEDAELEGFLMARAGVWHPFDESAVEALPKMSGMPLRASSVRKVAERVGEDLAQRPLTPAGKSVPAR